MIYHVDIYILCYEYFEVLLTLFFRVPTRQCVVSEVVLELPFYK